MAKVQLNYFIDVPSPHRQFVEVTKYLVGFVRGNSFVIMSRSHTYELAVSRLIDYRESYPERDYHIIRCRSLLLILE